MATLNEIKLLPPEDPITVSPTANALVTPAHIVPEWYFLPFYAILRAVPSKLGGVLLMGLSIAILFILPFLQIIFRSTFTPARFLYNNLIFFFFFTVILLCYL